jgi:hypothetical protein
MAPPCMTTSRDGASRSAANRTAGSNREVARPFGGKSRRHLLARQPLEAAEAPLAQVGVDVSDLEAERRGDDAGGLPGAEEVARGHRPDPLGAEPPGDVASLFPPSRVERDVGLPLPPPGRVPVGLAVSREVEDPGGGHGAIHVSASAGTR